jgi:hypothetical protein
MLNLKIAALALLCAVPLGTFPPLRAAAHDAPTGWSYPWSCCSNQDCRAVSHEAIEEGPDGYVVTVTGELVPYRDRRVKESPDGEFPWCAHKAGLDEGHTICLFVPPRGF